MNELTPAQIVDYITKTQPQLLRLVLLQIKPYMRAIEERCEQVDYGTVSLTLHVRAGEVEKMEVEEKHVWLRQKAS